MLLATFSVRYDACGTSSSLYHTLWPRVSQGKHHDDKILSCKEESCSKRMRMRMKAVDFTTEGGNTGCEIAFHYSRSLLTTLRRRGWFVLHMPTPTRREPSVRGEVRSVLPALLIWEGGYSGPGGSQRRGVPSLWWRDAMDGANSVGSPSYHRGFSSCNCRKVIGSQADKSTIPSLWCGWPTPEEDH